MSKSQISNLKSNNAQPILWFFEVLLSPQAANRSAITADRSRRTLDRAGGLGSRPCSRRVRVFVDHDFIVILFRHVENVPHEVATLRTAVRRASRRIRCVPSEPRSLLPPASSPPILLPTLVLADSRSTIEPTRHSLAADLKSQAKKSQQTVNHYLRAIKQFTRWLVRDHRTDEDRLAFLQGGNVKTDRRLERRELNELEIQYLLQTV